MPKFKNDTKFAYVSKEEAANKIADILENAKKLKGEFQKLCEDSGEYRYWIDGTKYVPSTDREEWSYHSGIREYSDIDENASGMWVSSSDYC